MIDMHTHTSYSDGEYSPTEIVRLAKEVGVTTLGITDHERVAGLEEGRAAAKEAGIRFFCGIEIGLTWKPGLHMLGYGIDPESAALHAYCEDVRQKRRERKYRLVDYLTRRGVPITLADVERYNGAGKSGRPHFARAMVGMGYATSIDDAFARHLEQPEFYSEVEFEKPSIAAGIEMIHAAGGYAVLAHPHRYNLENSELDALLAELCKAGIDGIEAYYSRHTPEQTSFYLQLAEKYHLFVTCGSDFHGPNIKPQIKIGRGIDENLCIADEKILAQLPEKLIAS